MRRSRFASDESTPGKAAVASILVVVVIIGLAISYHFFNYHNDPEGIESDLTKNQIDSYIKDYIMNNPEVIFESMQQYKEKVFNEMQFKVQQNIEKIAGQKNNIAKFPYIGNSQAENSIIFLFDYECGYCKESNSVLRELLKHNDKLKVIHHHFPVTNDSAYEAAKYALAVYYNYPEVYRDFHAMLMQSANISKDNIDDILSRLSLDPIEIEKYANKMKVTKTIEENIEQAKQISLEGTPAFIIGGELFKGYLKADEIQRKLFETGMDQSNSSQEKGANGSNK